MVRDTSSIGANVVPGSATPDPQSTVEALIRSYNRLPLDTDMAAGELLQWDGAGLVGFDEGAVRAAADAALGVRVDGVVDDLDALESSVQTVADVAPVYVETLTTGLASSSPANLRTGLSTATHASGGFVEHLAIVVTGTAGSAVLTSAETAKVAGLGSAPFSAVLNATDGSVDVFVTVLSHNGSTTITLRSPLAANFVGTLSPKYDLELGQHITPQATRAYVRHILGQHGLFASRGPILDGAWSARPMAYQTQWVANAALVAYGVSNSAAPVVQSTVSVEGALNVIDFDLLPIIPTPTSRVRCGTHTVGHGATATLRTEGRDGVLEFWTGARRAGASVAAARMTVTVVADGVTLYNQVHDGYLRRVLLPIHQRSTVVITVTNLDGSIYYINLSQLTYRAPGVGGKVGAAGTKVVLMGDSWFAFYGGIAATYLSELSGAEVVNRSLSGMTTEWALAWFDAYVLAEQPDEVWFHFFTNDANDLSAQTFVAPDGSTPPRWPAGLTGDQHKDHWRSNLRKLVARCQAAGIRPVIVLPGGTAAAGQSQKHTEWHWWAERPRVERMPVSASELADPTAYVNVVGKATGTPARVGTSVRYAQGPAAADLWKNTTDDAVAGLQRLTLSRADYAAVSALNIGTDTNADGLSDGVYSAAYGSWVDTVAESIVSGRQRLSWAYGTGTGNKRYGFQYTAVAGAEYLVIFDVVNGGASETLDAVSDVTGPGVTWTTLDGYRTLDGSGAGPVWVRGVANAAGTKYATLAPTRTNSTTEALEIAAGYAINLDALKVDAPNTASMSTAELVAFIRGMQP